MDNFNMLDDLDESGSLNNEEMAVLNKIGAVLKKHGLEDRFCIALLHKHFDLLEGEVMVERVCKKTRAATRKPELISPYDEVNFRPSLWAVRNTSEGGLIPLYYLKVSEDE